MREDIYQKVVALLKEGSNSNRGIAKLVFGRSSMESTIRNIKKKLIKSDELKNTISPYGVKVLIADIETAPLMGYMWGRWKQNISQVQLIREGYILCCGWQWLGDEQISVDALPFYEKSYIENPHSDYHVVKTLWHLLDQADIVVFHNGDKFDIPYMNTRFLYYGLGLPSPYKSYDTLRVAKKTFRFSSNSLDSLGDYLGVGRKVKHQGFSMWREIDETFNPVECKLAWDNMTDYQYGDIDLLREVYLAIRAYDNYHPNLNMFTNLDKRRCNICLSENVELIEDKIAITNFNKFSVYKCSDCGHYHRSRLSILSPSEKRKIISNVTYK